MFRPQQIIIREYDCTSLKLLNYLKKVNLKSIEIIPGVVAAERVARGLTLCRRNFTFKF